MQRFATRQHYASARAWRGANTLTVLTAALLILGGFHPNPGTAQTARQNQAQPLTTLSLTEVREQGLQQAAEKAALWGLQPTDWVRYTELMAGPRGAWSPNADPISVLGASARNPKERQRLADLFVKLEYERTEAELQFTRAVSAAWKRNFPNQQVMAANALLGTKARAKTSKQPTALGQHARIKRVALVLEKDCAGCGEVLSQYLAMAERSNDPTFALDVFLRQTQGDDNALRDWVASTQIPVKLIQTKRVTINHGEQYKKGAAPQVWLLRANGQWTVQR